MTTKDIFAAIYGALGKKLPAVTWQQARQPKPSVPTWGAITYEGEAPVSLSSPDYQHVYFKVWIYSSSTDETDLMNLTTAIKAALTKGYIISPSGALVRLVHVSTSPIYFAEEYQTRASDLTFRVTTNSIK